MKLKNKYIFLLLALTVLVVASAVMLIPEKEKQKKQSVLDEVSISSTFNFVYKIKTDNISEADRYALNLPLSNIAVKRIHMLLRDVKNGESTDSDKKLLELIKSKGEQIFYNNTVAEIEKIAASEYNALAKNDEKTESEAKNAVNYILGTSIKFTPAPFTSSSDIICLETANMYVELLKKDMTVIFLSYECEKGERKLSPEESRDRALRFIRRNLSVDTHKNPPKVDLICECRGCDCYIIGFDGFDIWIKIRTDTGSVVYFDACEMYNNYSVDIEK